MIKLNQVAKSFGDHEALRSASFLAEDGAITTLLGGNGAGKTTSLRIITGLVRPDSGTAEVDGLDCTRRRSAVASRLGVLHDDFGLFARLTTREHLRCFAALQGLRAPDAKVAVEEVIELLDLGAVADRRTGGFSYGERLKVALGRALVGNPKNLLLDEPTRGLDVHAVRLLRSVLRRLRASDRCILMTSHAMAEVETLSDQVVVLARGRVIAVGAPDQLRQQTGADTLEDAFIQLTSLAE